MKLLAKHIFNVGFLLAVLASASCQKDTGEAVEFRVPQYTAELEPKAVVRDAGFVDGDAIGVMGYYVPAGAVWNDYKAYAKPDFMYNQRVSYNGATWSYAPKMYWPQIDGAKVNFYSYFPYGDGTSETGVKVSAKDETGEPGFKFVLNESADVDLMVASAEGCSSASGSVSLPFKHILGKLQFKFSVSNPGGFSYVVNKIHVMKTPKEADFSWDGDVFAVSETGSIEASAGEHGAGCLIDSTDPRLVEDFTMFLMPSDLGEVQVTINNEAAQIVDLSAYKIESGKVLTISFVINLSGISFTTSIDDWDDGGTYTPGNGQYIG